MNEKLLDRAQRITQRLDGMLVHPELLKSEQTVLRQPGHGGRRFQAPAASNVSESTTKGEWDGMRYVASGGSSSTGRTKDAWASRRSV